MPNEKDLERALRAADAAGDARAAQVLSAAIRKQRYDGMRYKPDPLAPGGMALTPDYAKPQGVDRGRNAMTQAMDYLGNFLMQGRAPELGAAVRQAVEPVAQWPFTAVTKPLTAANQAIQALDPSLAFARGYTNYRMGVQEGLQGNRQQAVQDILGGLTEMAGAGLSAIPGGVAAKGFSPLKAAPTRPSNAMLEPTVKSTPRLIGAPEIIGGATGGAVGAAVGETPEERTQNALVGVLGGGVAGKVSKDLEINPTTLGTFGGPLAKTADEAFVRARSEGYKGADIGEAKEWVAARSKGLDMSPEARAARAKEMGFLDTVWYHGTARLDRLLEKQGLDPKRATSGPMPYFTENPQIASKYAIGKADNSLPENQTYAQAFTVSPKDLGQAKTKTPYTVEQSWYFLSPEQKKTILDRAKRVGYENFNEGMGPLKLHPEGVDATLSSDQFDYIMKTSARGNPLAALRELWLDSGALFNEEQMLKDIYKLAGYPHRISDSTAPWYEAQGILNAKLRMLNPVVTDDAQTVDAIIKQLKQDFATDRTRTKRFGADDWDKNTRYTPKEWVAQLEKDMSEGTNSYVWTSIPDKITSRLKAMGFDGVIDTGGKGGGIGHRVAIPFEANQVRSVNAAFDPAKKTSSNILASAPPIVGVGAAGATMAGQQKEKPRR